jgi:hypothetical protein
MIILYKQTMHHAIISPDAIILLHFDIFERFRSGTMPAFRRYKRATTAVRSHLVTIPPLSPPVIGPASAGFHTSMVLCLGPHDWLFDLHECRFDLTFLA